MAGTEIYFETDDPELIEFFEEQAKAKAWEESEGQTEAPDWFVLQQWSSDPVPIYANDESGDMTWTVYLKDPQYLLRKAIFEDTSIDDPIDPEDPDADKKQKLKDKKDKMTNKKDKDKVFKKLDKKFKNKDDENIPLHEFGFRGGIRHPPEDRVEE